MPALLPTHLIHLISLPSPFRVQGSVKTGNPLKWARAEDPCCIRLSRPRCSGSLVIWTIISTPVFDTYSPITNTTTTTVRTSQPTGVSEQGCLPHNDRIPGVFISVEFPFELNSPHSCRVVGCAEVTELECRWRLAGPSGFRCSDAARRRRWTGACAAPQLPEVSTNFIRARIPSRFWSLLSGQSDREALAGAPRRAELAANRKQAKLS